MYVTVQTQKKTEKEKEKRKKKREKNKTKQNKTKQNKTKQNKTKQNKQKTKQNTLISFEINVEKDICIIQTTKIFQIVHYHFE
jgi:hypothetical protein